MQDFVHQPYVLSVRAVDLFGIMCQQLLLLSRKKTWNRCVEVGPRVQVELRRIVLLQFCSELDRRPNPSNPCHTPRYSKRYAQMAQISHLPLLPKEETRKLAPLISWMTSLEHPHDLTAKCFGLSEQAPTVKQAT